MTKLAIRDPDLRDRLGLVNRPQAHPSFRVVSGDVEAWEKRQSADVDVTFRRPGTTSSRVAG